MKEIRVHLLKGIESRIDHVKSVKELGYCYWKKANKQTLANRRYMLPVFDRKRAQPDSLSYGSC